MRYTPAALALSLVLAVTASVTHSAPPRQLDPRVNTLLTQGRANLGAGKVDAAVDAFETALTIEPGSAKILLLLGDATRRQDMQGKALHYYRMALRAEPSNLEAISGEGAALAEKGALEKARRNLARLEGLCGQDCAPAKTLSAVIAKGPAPKVLTAEAVTPAPVVSEN